MFKYLLILFLFVTNIFSQTPDSVKNQAELFDISLSASTAIPFGDLSKKSVSNPSGYAKIGINLNAGFGFNFSPSFGFVVKGIYMHFGTNLDNLVTTQKNQYQLYFGDILNDGRWDITGILGGVVYKNKITKKIYIENLIMGGFLNFRPREINIHYSNFFGIGGPVDVMYSESGSMKSVYNISSNLGYSFSKNFSMDLGLDYYYSRPEFNMVKTEDNLVSITEYKYTFARNVSLLNLALNLRYHFF